ncbi:MAG: hexokinase [Spirochaetes bacterium]|nr:hexokinase [Spirochaetota bacterium]
MHSEEAKVREFFRHYGMDPDTIDMDECTASFIEEMEAGLGGKKSSLPMLPSYIEVDKPLPENKRVVVLDAGGTNFRVAAVHFTEGLVPAIENFKSFRMPGSEGEIGKKRFFDTIAGYVDPVAEEGDTIGFCFSYPTQTLPNKDGILLYTSKELLAPEVIGEAIGGNLLDALGRAGSGKIERVVLLNDTVATLLAGRAVGAASKRRSYSGYIGFILGTGSNCSYVEKNRNILKVEGLDSRGSQVINAESGAFGRAPMGELDKRFDAHTKDPGLQVFEKMISGRYLGGLAGEVVRAAAKDGLFSNAVKHRLLSLEALDTEQMNEYMRCPTGEENFLSSLLCEASETDRIILYHLMDVLVERAAKFSAIHLCAFVLKEGGGENPCLPVCITAEGSVFYGLVDIRERILSYLGRYLKKKRKRYCEVIGIENAALIGAAVAGLTN